ncbi:glycosyltransferase family 87 protein [Kallotenue papyrolyticum]|uniref:glycosyltransferase family 87 protein n=1 Tax=Kallotenue papyrolyticum TaxID=1325125 RepID=UPI0004785CE8|nr:glycosyltransferase family 87 protein [Kallotenue papyrolyticum]
MNSDPASIPVAQAGAAAWQRLRRLGMALTALGCVGLALGLHQVLRAPSDLTQDYAAALALRAGTSIYGDHIGYVTHLFGPTLRFEQPFENFHPPFTAVLVLPLTLLPYPVAVLLWSGICLALYLGCSRLVLRDCELRFPALPAWLLLGAALCWYPVQAHLALGQLSLPVVASLLAGWALLRRQRDGWAGALIGLATLIKMFPGLLGLYLLLTRRWRALISMGATVLVGYGLCLALAGWDDVARYHQSVMARNVEVYGPALLNASLTGVAQRLFTEGRWVEPVVVAPPLARLVVALLAVPLLGSIVLLARHPQPDTRRDLGFAITCVAALLLSPLTWQHSFVLLWLPLALLWCAQPEDRRARRRWRAAWFAALALISLPDIEIARALMSWSLPYRLPWYAALPLLAPTIGLCLIWGLCLALGVAMRRSSAPAPIPPVPTCRAASA